MKPEGYKEQDCCATCKHMFCVDEYEEESDYYCHIDKSDRPLCGSILLDERFPDVSFGLDRDAYKKQYRFSYIEWITWSEPRSVKAWGYCSSYAKIEEE